jgi:putative flippase GtrA
VLERVITWKEREEREVERVTNTVTVDDGVCALGVVVVSGLTSSLVVVSGLVSSLVVGLVSGV